MAKGKREVPEVNSSSTADIAFLLLIFFLITTSMDTDQGLARRLPAPPEQNAKKNDDIKLKERNVLTVFLNFQDAVMCNGAVISASDLRQKAKEFIANPNDDPNMPEKHATEVPLLGTQMVTTNHVISLRCDRGSTYANYIEVQNEIVAAYNELRDECARQNFGLLYADCDEVQQEAIRTVYPQNISEAEPKKYGDK